MVSFAGNTPTPLKNEDLSDNIAFKKVGRYFSLPSGVLFWAEVLIPVAKAQELSLKEQIILFIKQKAQEYGVKEKTLIEVARCESNFVPTAFNPKDPNGGSYGIFQFQKPTFNAFKKEANMPELNYKDWESQAELAGWSFANGKERHWACFIQLKKKGII